MGFLLSLPLFLVLCWLVPGTISQFDFPLNDNFLLVVDGGKDKLFQLTLDLSQWKALSLSDEHIVRPLGIDYDPDNKKVYWTDTEAPAILRADIDGKNEEVVYLFTPDSKPESVAVDSISKLIFYTDSGKRSIGVMTLQGTHRKTLVPDLGKPRSIKLDKTNRKVYWTDWGNKTIESSNYDGTDTTVLVSNPAAYMNGLDIDFQEKQMYWADALNNKIFKSDLTGQNIMTVYETSDDTHLFGVAVDDTHLYVTDWTRDEIFKMRKNGTEVEKKSNVTDMPNGIVVYKSTFSQPGKVSSCSSSNGGCSHFCVPVIDGFKCLCPDSLTLEGDGKTCSVSQESVGPNLIWTEFDGHFNGFVRGIKGDPGTYLYGSQISPWTIKSPGWYWKGVDMFYKRNTIYLVDQVDRLIIEMSIEGSIEQKVIYYGTSSDVNGIAVDWLAGNVYWTDSLYNWIMVAKAEQKTENYKILIRTGMEKPHGIAVYPQKGMLVWSDWGNNTIETSTLSGENKKILAYLDDTVPHGLAIDYSQDRIYWCSYNYIESMALDGSDRKKLDNAYGNRFYDITMHKNFLMATDLGFSTASTQPKLHFYNLNDPTQEPRTIQLPRKPGGITMFHPDRQIDTTALCDSEGCDHLCVSVSENKVQCLCRDGFILNSDEKTCTETDNLEEPHYIYSLGDRLCSIEVKRSQSSSLGAKPSCFFATPVKFNFHALAFNYYQGEIYFSESKFKVPTIRRANMVDKTKNEVVVYGTGKVEGITVDWIHSNIYWTDSKYGQIWMSRLDGSYQRTMMSDLVNPHGIAVDPIRKKIYWSERGTNSTNGRIRRASLSCQDSSDFVSSRYVQTPTGIVIDFKRERLYWYDSAKNLVSYKSLNGRMSTEIRLPRHSPIDIAIFQDFLVFTETLSANYSGLQVVKESTGQDAGSFVSSQASNGYDVIAFDEHNQPGNTEGGASSSCAIDNGNCNQLCLQEESGPVCVCVEGMTFDKFHHRCIPNDTLTSDNFFLIADDYRHQIYMANEEFTKVTTINTPPLDRPIGLEYDPKEEMVYWTDYNVGHVKMEPLNGNLIRTVKMKTGDSRIDGLAFEPEARLLYYADMNEQVIGILNPLGNASKILVTGNLNNVRSIVLNPRKGHMYFGKKGAIEKADMDGVNRKVIINDTIGWASGLAISLEDEKLYWCDQFTERIEMSDFDGLNRKHVVTLDPLADPFAVAIQGDYIYWTDWIHRGINRASRKKTNQTQEVLQAIQPTFYTGLNDIKYFKNKVETNACSVDNGGCSHFCIPTPYGKTCACPDTNEGPVELQPNDKFNCPEIVTCTRDVSFGTLAENCPARSGVSCLWACSEGYGVATNDILTCKPDSQWSLDLTTLCTDKICEKLEFPDNSEPGLGCHPVSGHGVSCSQKCKEGFVQTGGDTKRTCMEDNKWSGKPIVCERVKTCPLLDSIPLTMVTPVDCTQTLKAVGVTCHFECVKGYKRTNGDNKRTCQSSETWTGTPLVCSKGSHTVNPVISTHKGKKDSNMIIIPTLAGIGVLALIIIIIIIVVVIKRRRRHGARYRNQRNLSDDDAGVDSPISTPPAFGHSMPVYDVGNDSVRLDSMAFDNPAYATHNDVHKMMQSREAEAPPLPEKLPLDFDDSEGATSDKSQGYESIGSIGLLTEEEEEQYESLAKTRGKHNKK